MSTADPEEGGCACAILLFAARRHPNKALLELDEAFERVINAFSAGHGYTHMAVDPCEAHQGVPQMIEADAHAHDVHYSDLDRYHRRPYVRIPVNSLKVDCDDFCVGVRSLLGQPYSAWKLLSIGVADPHGLICADVITRNLPDRVLNQIEARLKTRFHWGLTCTRRAGKHYVTPNGYALALGLPPGSSVARPDVRLSPQPPIN